MTALSYSGLAPLLLLSQRLFLYALAALVAFRILNGRISTRGLLRDPQSGGISTLRLQLLIATALAAASYAAAISQQTTCHFPAVDARLLALVGASNGLVILEQAIGKLGRSYASLGKS